MRSPGDEALEQAGAAPPGVDPAIRARAVARSAAVGPFHEGPSHGEARRQRVGSLETPVFLIVAGGWSIYG